MACFRAPVQQSCLDLSALERIQAYVRRYAAERREVRRLGPFLATFGRHSNGPYLNYAVPDDGSAPTSAEIASLVEVYEGRHLRPRVEVMPLLAPEATGALAEAGFRSEGTFSLMACWRDSLLGVVPPVGTEIVIARDEEQCRALLEVRNDAFGEPGPVTAADVQRALSSVAGGGIAAVIVDVETGRTLGSGACLVPYDGVTELTSIGVRRASRRRGIGAALTAALAG